MADFEITVEGAAPALLAEIFGSPNPVSGSEVQLEPGMTAVHRHHVVRRGVLDSGMVLSFIIHVTQGVAVKVLADWLSAKLKDRAAKVKVNGASVDVSQSESVARSIGTK